jgi:hypothetical protein
MAMSIPPAEMLLQATTVQTTPPTWRSSETGAGAAVQPQEVTTHSSSTPSALPPNTFSTDMKVDDQHQVYYAIVDDRSGDELFEIPPEALRKIGESLHLPPIGESGVHGVDVKS